MAVEKKNSFQTFFGVNAEKAAFTSMLLGDKYFETDTGLMFIYTGSAWVADSEDVLTLGAGTAVIGKVIISSNAMELYGASIATRPLATAVPAGTSFTVVAATIVVYLSDGTNWIEV